MTDPRFRTLITCEVLTTREAFGDDPALLVDADSVALIDRQEPMEVPPAIYQRLMELHNASRTGFNIETRQPRTDVVAQVLLEMDQTDANWDSAGTGDSDYPTAEDYMADLMWRFARQLHGDTVRIKGGDK